MKILALDLGTKLGYAVGDASEIYECGTYVLAKDKDITAARKLRMDRRGDARILTLYEWLELKCIHYRPDWITFEDVQFSSTTMQTQLWSSFRTVVWLFAAKHGIKVECCPVTTLKSFAAKHGGATKDMMAAAIVQKDKRFSVNSRKEIVFNGKIITDDAVDAAHLLNWSLQTLRNIKP